MTKKEVILIELIILLIIILSTVALVILSFLYFLYYREEKKAKVTDNYEQFQDVSIENARNDFRIGMNEKNCYIKLVLFENPQLSMLENKYFYGDIENMSAGGFKFSSNFNIPIDKKVLIQTILSIKSYNFTLMGEIIRKEKHKYSNRISYGVKFTNISNDERARIVRALNELMIEKKKKVKQLNQ
ncbi:PilZ domain-containing protein [Gracilibacillus sp. HCP3S3_G5_1]|uniref:PilZ domain-containing protein n=1 Tax=unclassified Gracilibacillus TaxID=2625209 RepID=UPI003F8B099F